MPCASAPPRHPIPRWESLQQLAQLYKQTNKLASQSGFPILTSPDPRWLEGGAGFRSGSGSTWHRRKTPGPRADATIAKVQVVFNLVDPRHLQLPEGQ